MLPISRPLKTSTGPCPNVEQTPPRNFFAGPCEGVQRYAKRGVSGLFITTLSATTTTANAKAANASRPFEGFGAEETAEFATRGRKYSPGGKTMSHRTTS